MDNTCELCRRDMLEAVYEPLSPRGLKVHLCRHCGMVQSMPRIDRAPRTAHAISGGADWGNVRYGKAFRTKAAIKAIKHHADLNRDLAVLDVGSNRGSFARAFLEIADYAHLVALEPDERVVDSCKELPRTETIHARIEDAALETERFDIVHSCHTIEHLAHPARVLADHWRVLKPNGLLVLDAPNLAFLDMDDIVEEWFIDKHLHHFSARTLMRMVEAAGFAIIDAPDLNDRENLLIVAQKSAAGHPAARADAKEVAEAERLLAAYGATRARNLAALTFAATEIANMAPKRVAIWGAGRLFDTLVVQGGLATSALAILVDAHLVKYASERHGYPLSAPQALEQAKPDVIVIMSRGFAEEIAAQAAMLAPKAEIVFYSDLISRAVKLRKAA
ncbi:MAG: class I SAM-dependent methyltransferase [Rhizomicrobium sp.]